MGGYDAVETKIREFAALGISMFFINGYPHLEEIYRLGEHILPRFRASRTETVANDLQPIPLVGGQGLAARGNS